MPSGSTTTNLELDPETKERVQRIAIARRRTEHGVMRDAIEQYLLREERQEQMYRDALAAYEHYQKTGLHVTEEEAHAWLMKLAAGEDADPPECHV